MVFVLIWMVLHYNWQQTWTPTYCVSKQHNTIFSQGQFTHRMKVYSKSEDDLILTEPQPRYTDNNRTRRLNFITHTQQRKTLTVTLNRPRAVLYKQAFIEDRTPKPLALSFSFSHTHTHTHTATENINNNWIHWRLDSKMQLHATETSSCSHSKHVALPHLWQKQEIT